MMGLRDYRLRIIHSGITKMQVKTIAQAALNEANEGILVHSHIAVPLVDSFEEL